MTLRRASLAFCLASLVSVVSVVSVSPSWAQATGNPNVVVLTAQLSGANENPPPATTGAHGNARVVVDRAAGTITYEVNVYNLPTGLTGSHIHVGPAGSNGPIILDFRPQTLGISDDFSLSGTLTAADLRPNAAAGIDSFEDAVFSIASGVAYMNVHTQANPGGEIRGQLCPDSPSANRFNGVSLCPAVR